MTRPTLPRTATLLALIAGLTLQLPAALAQTPGANGLAWTSADGRSRVRLGGYFQVDGRFFPGDDADQLTGGFLLRRARLMVEGTIATYFGFRLMPDFGSGAATIYDAYLEARLDPALVVRAGKFKPPLGLERRQSATDLRFIERGFPTNLAPNRDVGLEISGVAAAGALSWQAGVFNGVPDLGFGDGDATDDKDVIGRVFLIPFAGRGRRSAIDFGFGLAASAGTERGTPSLPLTSALRAPGQATFFRYRTGAGPAAVVADGRRTRLYPQAYLYHGPLGVLAEYVSNWHSVRLDAARETFRHHAWQIAGSVVLTGETLSYEGVTPRRDFDPRAGTWGAVELALRFQSAAVDRDVFPAFADPALSARRALAWAVGVNWHFARRLKLMADLEHTTFDGGRPGGDRPAETFVATRLQFAY